MASILKISREESLSNLVNWDKTLSGFMIDGDDITIEHGTDVKEFIDLLDQQYATWNRKEKRL